MSLFKREICAVTVTDGPVESNLSWREAKRIFKRMKQNDKQVIKFIKRQRWRATKDLDKTIQVSCTDKKGHQEIKRLYTRSIKYNKRRDISRKKEKEQSSSLF